MKTLRLFVCNAPLEVLHSNLVVALDREAAECVLVKPEWVSARLAARRLWSQQIEVEDSRPEYGRIAQRIRRNLGTLDREIRWQEYGAVELVVSDLSWLQNNILVATLAQRFRRGTVDFSISILDEGSVLYTGQSLGIRRQLRAWAKYAFQRVHGFAGVWVHNSNIDYRHPLCRRVYCVHPEMLDKAGASRIEVIPIRTSATPQVFAGQIPEMQLGGRWALYLSQPLYKLVGEEEQLEVARQLKSFCRTQGMERVYYKPHHADLPGWCNKLEQEGFMPLPLKESLAIEFLAAACDAEMIASHTTSALFNLHGYGYRGRVICFGLAAMRGSFPEQRQFDDFERTLSAMPAVERYEPGLTAAERTLQEASA